MCTWLIWTSKCIVQQSLQNIWEQDKWKNLSTWCNVTHTGHVKCVGVNIIFFGGDGGSILAEIRVCCGFSSYFLITSIEFQEWLCSKT